jgi:threonine synthase
MWTCLSRRGVACVRLLLRAARGDLRLRAGGGHHDPGADRLRPALHLAVRRPPARLRPAPVDLGAGFTPLIRADRLAAELGLGELWIKDDTANPTGSFKDRVVSVALTKARQLGFKIAACASTGNLANSVAAHAARAGMESVVLIPHDLESAKVTMTSVYGGRVIAVEGSYDDVNRLCAELTSEQPSWAFVNVNVRTYYAEGSKTLAFEVAEQLGWQAPGSRGGADRIGEPTDQGGQGVRRAVEGGTARRGAFGAISGAQAEGCSPVATAFAEGTDAIRPVKPNTIAKSLAIGNPADGWYALDAIRKSGGILRIGHRRRGDRGHRLAGPDRGIFAETAGGVTIATLAKLAAQGVIRSDERVVAMVTGHGLKTVEALAGVGGADRHHRPHPRSVCRGHGRRARDRTMAGDHGEPSDERHRPDPHPAAHPHRRDR